MTPRQRLTLMRISASLESPYTSAGIIALQAWLIWVFFDPVLWPLSLMCTALLGFDCWRFWAKFIARRQPSR